MSTQSIIRRSLVFYGKIFLGECWGTEVFRGI